MMTLLKIKMEKLSHDVLMKALMFTFTLVIKLVLS